MGGSLDAVRRARPLPHHQAAPHHAALRQHPLAGGNAVSEPVGNQRGWHRRSRCITVRSRSNSAARWRAPWLPASCRRWSVPRRSISASTGAMSIWSSRSAPPKARAACCSASAAPTTAWTNRPRRCSCRPTASRCSNARQRSKPLKKARRTVRTPSLGGLDVLAQHVLGMACAAPLDPLAFYDEIRRAWPYRDLELGDLRTGHRLRRYRWLRAARL